MTDGPGVRLYLIRHARTLPIGPDSHTWPLSPEGEEEAANLTEASFWEKVTALYSSPENKAISTVREAAARHGVKLRTDERLREVSRPVRWIDDYDAVVRRYLEQPEQPPVGWESAPEARARMAEFFVEVSARHPGESVAVCSHGLVLALYLGGLPGVSESVFGFWRSIGFARVAIVEKERLVTPFGSF